MFIFIHSHFVPNLTIGPVVVKSLRKHTNAILDCHLMVSDPQFWIESFAEAGANIFTFHYEAVENHAQIIKEIRAKGMKPSMAIKPKTEIDSKVLDLCTLLDMVLIMTVEPGFGGQSMMMECLDKVRVIREKFPKLDIEVDGGIGLSNIQEVADCGANVIVAGTSIFASADPAKTIAEMKRAFSK